VTGFLALAVLEWRSRHELFDSFCRYKKKALGSWSYKNKLLVLWVSKYIQTLIINDWIPSHPPAGELA
jgi:hypothetical protein